MQSSKTRVYLVDDHPLLLEALEARINLEPDMTVVGTALNSNDGFHGILETKPQLVVMDIEVPGRGSFTRYDTAAGNARFHAETCHDDGKQTCGGLDLPLADDRRLACPAILARLTLLVLAKPVRHQRGDRLQRLGRLRAARCHGDRGAHAGA